MKAGTAVRDRVLPAYVEIWYEGRCVARPERGYGNGQQFFNLEHDLEVFERKPGALSGSKPLAHGGPPAMTGSGVRRSAGMGNNMGLARWSSCSCWAGNTATPGWAIMNPVSELDSGSAHFLALVRFLS